MTGLIVVAGVVGGWLFMVDAASPGRQMGWGLELALGLANGLGTPQSIFVVPPSWEKEQGWAQC